MDYPNRPTTATDTVFVGTAVVGLASAVIPHTIGIPFDRYVLKMNAGRPGACAGAGTIPATLRAVQDEAGRGDPAPVTRYPTPSETSCSPRGAGSSWR